VKGTRSRLVATFLALVLVVSAAGMFIVVLMGGVAQAATYTVTLNTDQAVPVAGQLRYAIAQANLNPNSTIEFNIPGGGVQTITLLTAAGTLPTIVQPTTINGYTQPGSSEATDITPASIRVVLDASGAATASSGGFTFGPGSQGSVVKGLSIVNFKNAAVGTPQCGVYINNVWNITVQGNYLGVDPGNVVRANTHGVMITGINATALPVCVSLPALSATTSKVTTSAPMTREPLTGGTPPKACWWSL
jgi:hypothetical protein